jgi:hypothetical protein
MVDVKLTKAQDGPDEIEYGFYMVTRMQVDPMDYHYVSVTRRSRYREPRSVKTLDENHIRL